MSIPTISGGSETPEVGVGPASVDNNGSLYMRHNPTEGGGILYISRLSNASTGTYAWDVIFGNDF